MNWLEAHTPEGSVVLAPQGVSQFIPYVAGRKIVADQDVIMTQDFQRKAADVGRFFGSPGDDAFKQWMCSHYGVDYVLIATGDPAAGAIAPRDHPWLQPVLELPHAGVYAVQPAMETGE